ncbi:MULTISPECIES: LysR family transcriptional regulator [unclassified Pseudonocardia]|uniref:LysR family transcriptional regulator n=1 Tax=unclassified Pseudonocardia TaxID=2619320 RepID=UPI00094AF68B|nr:MULTISPECIES: LysR family transcriptional regulator [unclassified Pseudonocardia]OLM15526.1 transcriptional regulator, LysR family [Pseudonocardia sp. Ae505_Ps2]OLM32791.1 transcriptional regulator, LysR family [Pseudonocardia sp. Ae717_Ps2]
MPTLRALECLVAVFDHGSVTGAAAALHLSQPALSHQLAQLEREVGTPLLERLPRGVRPTVAGRAVHADAVAALEAAGRVLTTGRTVAAGGAGVLRVACAETMTAGLLAPVLRAAAGATARTRVELTELTSADEIAARVADGAADVGVCPPPGRDGADAEVLGREPLVAVLPRRHPLAGAPGPVPVVALGEGPVVHYDPANGLAGWLDTLAATHGVRLDAVTRTRSATTAARLADAGLGVAVVPVTALPAGAPGVVRALAPAQDREVVALTRPGRDPVVAAFVAALRRRGVPVPAAVAAQLAP